MYDLTLLNFAIFLVLLAAFAALCSGLGLLVGYGLMCLGDWLTD